VKIELIVPAVEENARVPNLALPILAGLSPADVEISFTDDLLTPIDLEKDMKNVDLVGITVLSKTALRAYNIADSYRRKGIPVVLGGIHPTAAPEEAKEHADMARNYRANPTASKTKRPGASDTASHCETLSQDLAKAARDARALAADHEAMAKQQ